jgi:hypothetical protein
VPLHLHRQKGKTHEFAWSLPRHWWCGAVPRSVLQSSTQGACLASDTVARSDSPPTTSPSASGSTIRTAK